MSCRERLGGVGPTAGPSRSATVARLERELKEVMGENAHLKEELSTIKSLYEQLVFEAPQEKFNERRVQLLKSKLYLLERQTVVQNQALQSRAQLLTDLATFLDYILDCSRDRSKMEEEKGNEKTKRREKPSHNSFTEDEVCSILEKGRGMRARISRSIHVCSTALPRLPVSLLVGPTHTVCTDTEQSVTTQLNLKYVSGLESELARLYGNLTELYATLQALPNPPPHSSSSSFPSPSPSLLAPLTDHHAQVVKMTSDLLADCCHHLLNLSLFSPTCSSPSLHTSSSNTTDFLLTQLKPHVRNRKEVETIVKRVVEHAELLQQQKHSALERELNCHKSVYQLQVNSVASLFEAVSSAYKTFEKALQDLVCVPLEDILISFSEFSTTSGENKLGDFLEKFQEREKSLRNVVESLKSNPSQDKQNSPQGSAALSAFGEQFFDSLHKLEQECHREKLLR